MDDASNDDDEIMHSFCGYIDCNERIDCKVQVWTRVI